MKDIKETLQKLQIGSQMESIRDGLIKEDTIFGQESSQAIYDMGRQTTSNVQFIGNVHQKECFSV